MSREELLALYKSHAARGSEKVRQGQFREALADYEEASRLAQLAGDLDLVHLAASNLSMVRLELGDIREAQKGLREMILRSRDQRVVLGATYNLAVSLRKQGNYGRALTYAHRAMRIATQEGDISSRAMCHNLVGNIYLGRSLFDDALGEYHRALRLRTRQDGDHRFSVSILRENIGYCFLLKRQYRRGMRWIGQALRVSRETGDRRCQAECLQDLTYARLHLGDNAQASRAGESALDLALAEGYADIERNCYYLLGEIAHKTGDERTRDRYFGLLQKQYPEVPFLRDFLCVVDVSGIIALKG